MKSIEEGKSLTNSVQKEVQASSMAEEHREKAVFHFEKLYGAPFGCKQKSLWIYLRGNSVTCRKWTDTELEFRQESFFWYMTGLQIPDFHLLIRDPFGVQRTTYLVSPRYSNDHAMWCGPPFTLEQLSNVFLGTKVIYDDEIYRVFSGDAGRDFDGHEVHTLPGTDLQLLERQLEVAECPFYIVQDGPLANAIAEARVLKTASELKIMSAAAEISSEAHKSLMCRVRSATDENDLAAQFQYECAARGAKHQAYNPIVACGRNGAILHYSCNSAKFTSDQDELILVDAGCELLGYASDITRCFPRSGVFRGLHANVYRAVLDANKQVIQSLKPGVEWEDMHKLALSVILDNLLALGLVKHSRVEDKGLLLNALIPDLFFPHGLGHLIGLDVHDCGGYPKGTMRFKEGSLKYLRMRRTLEPGMVLTVEPGLYFSNEILLPAIENPELSQYLNVPLVKEYMKIVGGVRIEDDVLITTNGCRVLSQAVPKEISEIEALMRH